MNFIAEFLVTMKTYAYGDTPNVKNAGIPVAVDWRVDRTPLGEEERDRAFAAIRKMFPEARQIALTAIAKREVVER